MHASSLIPYIWLNNEYQVYLYCVCGLGGRYKVQCFSQGGVDIYKQWVQVINLSNYLFILSPSSNLSQTGFKIRTDTWFSEGSVYILKVQF